MLPRIVELAANATPYDAAYVTLAERVDAPVLTVDAQLSRISGVPRRFRRPELRPLDVVVSADFVRCVSDN